MPDIDEFSVESIPLTSADPNEFEVDVEETEKRKRKVLALGITEPVQAIGTVMDLIGKGATAKEQAQAQAAQMAAPLMPSTQPAYGTGALPPIAFHPAAIQGPAKFIGAGFEQAGKDIVTSTEALSLYLAELGAKEDALKKLGAIPLQPGEEDPYEAGYRKLPYAGQLATDAARGLLHSVPKLGAMAAMAPAAGAAGTAMAGGMVFGMTPEGFSPEEAAIGALLPSIGKYSGEISGLLAKRLGIPDGVAMKILRAAGHVGGPTAYLSTIQASEIAGLAPEDRPEAIKQAVAANIGFLALTFPGGVKELQRVVPRWQGPIATGAQLPIPPALPQFGPSRPTPREMQTLRSTMPQPPRPTVPGTAAEPERGMSVIDEIRTKNARTKAEIQKLFPHLTREEAGQLRIQAWGTAGDFGVTVSPTIPIPAPMSPPRPAPAPPAAPARDIPQPAVPIERQVGELNREQLQQQIITWQRELDKALANKDGNAQREAIRKLLELRRQLEGPETLTPGKPPIVPKPPIPGVPRSAIGPEVPATPPEPERGMSVLEEIRAKNARTKEQIRALFPQLTREQAAQLRDQAWGAQPAGGPSASGVAETTTVYGDVRPQEAQTGGMPIPPSGPRVQPQAQRGIPQGKEGEVLLTEVQFPLKPGPGGKGNVDQLGREVEVGPDNKWRLKRPPGEEPPAAGAVPVPVPPPPPKPAPAAAAKTPEVVGARPKAPEEGPKPGDYDDYMALYATFTQKSQADPMWLTTLEGQTVWSQMDAIKNRHGGNPPPKPESAAAVTGQFLGVDAPMWTAEYVDSQTPQNRAAIISNVKSALAELGLKTRLVGDPNGTMIANAIKKIIAARAERAAAKPAAPSKDADAQKIAETLGVQFDHEFTGAGKERYWSFTLFDNKGELSTSISVPVGSKVEDVLAIYRERRALYGDDPNAPRPPKTDQPPPEAGAAPTPAPPPTPPAPVAPAAKAQTPPPPTPESLAAAPSAPPVPEQQGGKVPEDGETFTWRGATLRLSKGRFGWSVTQESPGPTEFSNTGYRSLTEFGRMGEEGQEPTMADLVAALDKAAAENKAESDKALRNAKRELKKAAKEGPGKDSASVIIHFSMTGDGLLNKLRSQTDVKTQIEMANLAAQAYQIAADVPPAKETSGAWTPQIVAESKAQNAKQAEVARRFAADLEARSKAAPGTEWKAWDIIDKAKRESTPAEPDELGLQRPEVFPQISTGWYEEATRPAEVVEDRWQSQFARNTEDMYRDPVEGQTTPYLIQAKLADLAEWERWAQRKAPEVLAKHKAENDEIRRLLLEKQPAVAAEWAERDRQAEEAAAKAAAEKKKGKRKKASPPVPIPGETVAAPPVPEAPAAAPEEPPAHPIDALLAKVGVEGTGKVGEVMDSNGRKRPGGYTSPAMTEAQLTELSGLADKAGWDIQGYEPAKRKLRRGVFTPKPTAREKRIAELEKNISLYEQSLEPDSFVKVNLPEAQVRSRIAEYKAELERLKRGEEPPPEEPPPGAPVPIPPGPKPTAPAAPPVPPIATAMREGDREPTLNRFLLQSGGRGIGFARLAGEGEAYRSGRTTRAIFNKFQRKAADAGWESSFLPAPEGKGGTIMVRRKAAPAPEPSFEDETRRMRTDPQPGDVVEHPDFGRVEILPESTEETVRFQVLSSRKRASLPRTEWVQDMTLLDKTIEAPPVEGEMTPDKRAQIRTELGLDAFDVDRLSRAMGISQEEFYEMRPAYHRNAPAAMYAATKNEFLEFETAIDERNFKKVQRMYQYDPSLDQKLFQGFFRNVTKAKDPWVWEKESKAAEAEPNIEAMAEAEMERAPGEEPSRPPEETTKPHESWPDDVPFGEKLRDLADQEKPNSSARGFLEGLILKERDLRNNYWKPEAARETAENAAEVWEAYQSAKGERPVKPSEGDVTMDEAVQLLDDFQMTGDIATVRDLADAAERLADERTGPMADRLRAAVEEYRENVKEDYKEYGGRGDADAYEEEFTMKLGDIANELQYSEGEASYKTNPESGLAEPVAAPKPKPITAENISSAFKVPAEVGKATVELANAMGLPLDKIMVIEGGEPSPEALLQLKPRYARSLQKAIKAGAPQAKLYELALKLQKRIQRERSFWKYNPDKPWLEDNKDPTYWGSVDPDILCQKSVNLDKAVRYLKDQLGDKFQPGNVWDLLGRASESGLQVPCPPCYVFALRSKSGTGQQKRFVVGVAGYNGELTRTKQAVLDRIAILRHYSSSDFKAEHIPGLMAELADMVERKQPMGAYSKTADLAHIMGPARMYINMSIGRDEAVGMNRAVAERLRAKYPNVSTVYVAFNDAENLAAARDPQVDHVLPFHISGQSMRDLRSKVRDPEARDYTFEQREKVWVNGGRDYTKFWQASREERLKMLFSPNGIMKNAPEHLQIKDAEHRGDPQAYLQLVKERGVLPRFPFFLEALQKTGELDAYMKFVGPEYGKHGSKYPYEPPTPTPNEAAIEPAIRNRRVQADTEKAQLPRYMELARDIAREVQGGTWVNPGKPQVRSGPFEQKGRAAVEFLEDGTALIRALENPDASTGAHELAHIARRWILDPTVPAENRYGITDEHILAAEEWAGAKDGNWTVEAEEKFARGFERYLRDGKAPTSLLEDLFSRFKAWLSSIYQKIKGSDVDLKISPEMRKVYDALTSRGQRPNLGPEVKPEMMSLEDYAKLMPEGTMPGTTHETHRDAVVFAITERRPVSAEAADAQGFTARKMEADGYELKGDTWVHKNTRKEVPPGAPVWARTEEFLPTEEAIADRGWDRIPRFSDSLEEITNRERIARDTEKLIKDQADFLTEERTKSLKKNIYELRNLNKSALEDVEAYYGTEAADTIRARMAPDKLEQGAKQEPPTQTTLATQDFLVGIPFPALKPLVAPLKQVQGVLGQRLKNIDPRHTLDQLADAADNKANILGQQMGNKLRLGKSNVQQVAASAVIAAEFNSANLPGILAMVQGKNAEAEAGVRYAMAHYAESERLAKLGQRVFDWELRWENNAGINTPYLQNYLPGLYDRDVWMGVRMPYSLGGGRGISTSFKKVKTFPSPFHAIGDPSGIYKPVSLRIGDLVEHRVRTGQRLVNRKMMGDALKGVTAPSDGKALAADLVMQSRAPGMPKSEVAPAGYQPREIIPGTRIAIHDDFVKLFDAVTGRSSAVAEWEPGGLPLGEAMLQTSGFVKHGLLLFDTFHASRMMQKEMFFNRRLPSWSKGRALLEYQNSDLARAVAEGEITQKMADWIRTQRPTAKLLLDNGLNVGRIQEAMYSGAIRAIQGKLAEGLQKLGVPKKLTSGVEFNKWVFEKLTRGAMMQSSLIAFERVQKANPTWSSEQVARKVARDMNVYFGNLGRQGIFKSPTALDASRIAFLAPQWVEGLARSEIQGAFQLAKGAVDSGLSGSIKVGSLGTALGQGVFAYFVATQLLNLFTRGHFTWDNPEKGHKLDAWIPDVTGKGPGFFISPLSVVAELTHDMLRYVPEEREADTPSRIMAAAAHIARNRSAPLWRSGRILFTGKDWDQQKITGWDERLLKAGLALAPVPIGVSPALRGDAPQGQVQRQITASLGFKTEPVKTQGAQLYMMARDWLGEQEDAASRHKYEASMKQDFGRSDYMPLRRALDKGNLEEARAEYDKLLTFKKPRDIMDVFRPHVLTADGTVIPKPVPGLSRPQSARFLRSLTPEEMRVYKAAREEDRLEYRRFLEMLQKTRPVPSRSAVRTTT